MAKPTQVVTSRPLLSDNGTPFEATSVPCGTGKIFVSARPVSGPAAGLQVYGETFSAGATADEIEADIRARLEIA